MERGKSFIGEMFNFVKTFTPEQKKLSIMVAAFGWLFYHALNTYQMLKKNNRSATNQEHKEILEKIKAFWKKHFTQITAKTAWLISAIIIATNFLVQIILSQFSLINIINILTLVWLFWIAILFVLKKIFKKEYLMNKAK